ncbi:hypothetical protein [Accumulibacter sp.]|uniref:hypothetical protein n=1 Tax=Accumulibacter sp. TaxID=2053492 RepID=UPI001ACE17AD|nr:hypothetical protein [Accumulibacter sp.]MBN8453058.1 hypothetical protein [Accumulibacter sp.]
MLKEFALEPEAVATWASFKDLIEKFGVSKGRVIAAFPRKWRQAVLRAAQEQARDVERARIVEKLQRLEGLVLLDRNRPSGDGALPWLDRVLVEHDRLPFDGIIVRERQNAHPKVLTTDEVDDDPPLFQATGQKHIRRTADEIVDCVALLVSCAQTIKLVDPHFKPNELRWKRPLMHLLKLVRDSGRIGVSIEVHRDNSALPGNIRSYFEGAIPRILPPGVGLSVHLHPEQALHNRFILTERGGASYQTGLDDNKEGRSTDEDLVTLLEPATFEREWRAYPSSDQPFLSYPPSN